MTYLTAVDVKSAIENWPSAYRTREGRVVIGERVKAVPKALIDVGWRNVSNVDEWDLKKLGLEIVDAEYVSGARPTGKFVRVVVVREAREAVRS